MIKDPRPIGRSPNIRAKSAPADPRADFKQSLARRFVVRFHMTLMLGALGVSGVLVSKLLLETGVRSMFARYLIAVVLSYALFFLFIRLWLMYVSPPMPRTRSRSFDVDVGNSLDIGDFSLDVAGKGVAAGNKAFGGGGDFGGGGATDMWGGDAGSRMSTPSTGGRSGGGFGGFDFDLGDEAIVLIALGLLLLVIFGAGAYLVYAAPEILSEAAFQAVLAAGLIKASKKMDGPGWMGSVLKATWVPFMIVFLMTGAFGWIAQTHYPHATRLADIFKTPSADGRHTPSSSR